MIGAPYRRRVATSCVLAAMALVVLDAGMTNVALPTIAKSLNVSPAASILAVGAYQLALVMGLLPAAHVAERLGGRPLFRAGVTLFTLASLIVALAPAFPVLVAGRVIQGFGGSAILALGIALLRSTLGTERLGSAIAWNALNVALCAAAGPAIGALILAIGDWRWIYLVNVPLGLIVGAATLALPQVLRTRRSIDWISVLLHLVGAGSFFLGLQFATRNPALALMAGGIAVGGVSLLIMRERPKAAPLIPLDLLECRPFSLAVSASVACFVAHSAGLLALTFYLQLELALDTLSTGAVLAGWPLAVAITSPWANRMAIRSDPSLLCAAGAGFLALGLTAAAFVPTQGVIAPLALSVVLCGMGFGLFQVPNNRNLFLAVPPERSAAAGGMQGTARLTGQTFGAVMVALLFASPLGTLAPRLALLFAASAAGAAALFSVRRSTLGTQFSRPQRV